MTNRHGAMGEIKRVDANTVTSNEAGRKPQKVPLGTSSIENIKAPSSAKATVQAMGLQRRPSTRWRVKMGRYAVIMMPMA